jgi:hypothetical protein
LWNQCDEYKPFKHDRVEIGKRRVEQIVKAFDVHPAIVMFPEYEGKEIQKAA